MAPEADGIVRRPDEATSAFLLIHGFAAAPDEVGTLGTFLERNDVASLAIRLAGHATSPEELAKTNWQDWYSSVKRGLAEIKSWQAEHIFVAGFSMGGLLSIILSAEETGIDGFVAICPAIKVPSKLAKLLPVLKKVRRYQNVNLHNVSDKYDVPRTKYAREPLSAIHEFFRLRRIAETKLKYIRIPTLVIQAAEDKTISPTSGEIVYNGISSSSKQLYFIEGAEHVIPCHPTRENVYPLILDFIKEVTKS